MIDKLYFLSTVKKKNRQKAKLFSGKLVLMGCWRSKDMEIANR